jgi:phosphoribosylformylglycinamidine cyclo-ligase
MNSKLTYKEAGVDVEAGYEAVKEIKDIVKETHREEVLSDLGGFGGLFALNSKEYDNPVLVAGTDGVGTKLKLAFMMDNHKSVGIDLVAMCVNDILAQGAEPLFFLDYIATSKVEPKKVKDIVYGISEGCKQSNCAILGGETAEMPGFYAKDEYDLAGFAVGIVDRNNILPKDNIQEGDILIGLKSSGVHSNGFTLLRKLVFDVLQIDLSDYVKELGDTIGNVLLTPTKIYVKEVLPAVKRNLIKGIVHVTGGGFYENIPRVLPGDLDAKIKVMSWDKPEIFDWIKSKGQIEEKEMYSTFNMGIGMILVVNKDHKDDVLSLINAESNMAFEIGYLTKGSKEVVFYE